MIKKLFSIITIVLFMLMVLPLITGIFPFEELSPVASHYVSEGADELGAANLVTSVIVTYRGLDTLGEVTVLFIATAGVGFLLRREEDMPDFSEKPQTGAAGAASDKGPGPEKKSGMGKTPGPEKAPVVRASLRESSELLLSGSMFLFPLLVLFGAYIFIHGHLTPGGGFQGGVVIASAMLLLMLARVSLHLNHLVLSFIESLSGLAYVAIGIAGIFLAAGFLDNRILPLGDFGTLLSAGAIPVIYSLIGLKVGTELTNILITMRGEEQS